MPELYASIIMETTGCSAADAERIEDVMRHDIFHSTLDWQTREELEEAARLAVAILQEMDRHLDADSL